jgi:hypothetical protein
MSALVAGPKAARWRRTSACGSGSPISASVNVAERALVHAGEGFDQQRTQLVERARPLRDELARDGEDLVQLQPLVAPADRGHRGRQDRLERRSQRRVVGGADQVERGAHRGRADDAALVQRVVELFPAEAVEPGPQREERRLRLLRLEAAEAVDRFGDGCRLPLQQHLAGERRAVEGPEREVVHVLMVAHAVANGGHRGEGPECRGPRQRRTGPVSAGSCSVDGDMQRQRCMDRRFEGACSVDRPKRTHPFHAAVQTRYSTRTYCRARAPGTRTVTRYSPGRRGRKNRR